MKMTQCPIQVTFKIYTNFNYLFTIYCRSLFGKPFLLKSQTQFAVAQSFNLTDLISKDTVPPSILNQQITYCQLTTVLLLN